MKMTAERQPCGTCGSTSCRREEMWKRVRHHAFDCPCTACEVFDEDAVKCQLHKVDWRSRALAAEAKLAAIEGAEDDC